MYMFKCILVILGYVQLLLGTTITRNYSHYNPASSVPKSESSGKSTEQTHLKHILEDIGREFYQLSKDINALRKEFSENSNSVAEKLEKLNAKVSSGFENSTVVLDQLDRKVDLITEMVETKVGTCETLLRNGQTTSGVYRIRPNMTQNISIKVYCDMEDDGGGWTVIQRRGVRSIPKIQRESFHRNWTEYNNGFGSASDDHWIGLRNINSLTQSCENELKIIMTMWNGTELYGKYSKFQVSGKHDGYRLTVGKWAGGTLSYDENGRMENDNGEQFTTYDNKNDQSGGCPWKRGAWWHPNGCGYMSLNGEYAADGSDGYVEDLGTRGIYWFPNTHYSYMKSEMKIRANC